MNHKKLNRFATLAAVCTAMAGSSAHAANSLYAPGDLIMFFQQQGGANTVYVNLGAATDFRGSSTGADVAPSLNIADLGTTLTTAFGAGWASDTSLYAGLAGVYTNVETPLATVGDPGRTVYISNGRSTLGDLTTQGSLTKTVATDGAMSAAAGAILGMNTPFANGPDQEIGIFTTSASQIDDKNPFLSAGIQGTAFGAFAGGVQQVGSASTLGSVGGDYAALGEIEFALDLYRIYGDTFNLDPNRIEGPLRQGTYEGTFLLGNNGMVSFIPEPSSVTLCGLAASALLLRRRRNA